MQIGAGFFSQPARSASSGPPGGTTPTSHHPTTRNSPNKNVKKFRQPPIQQSPQPQKKSPGSIYCATKKPGVSSPQNFSATPPGTSISSGSPNISTTPATSTSNPWAP